MSQYTTGTIRLNDNNKASAVLLLSRAEKAFELTGSDCTELRHIGSRPNEFPLHRDVIVISNVNNVTTFAFSIYRLGRECHFSEHRMYGDSSLGMVLFIVEQGDDDWVIRYTIKHDNDLGEYLRAVFIAKLLQKDEWIAKELGITRTTDLYTTGYLVKNEHEVRLLKVSEVIDNSVYSKLKYPAIVENGQQEEYGFSFTEGNIDETIEKLEGYIAELNRLKEQCK